MHKTIEYSSIMHTVFFIVQMFCQLNVLLFFNVSTQKLLQKKNYSIFHAYDDQYKMNVMQWLLLKI